MESVEREGGVWCQTVHRIPVAFHVNVILSKPGACLPDVPPADAKGLL